MIMMRRIFLSNKTLYAIMFSVVVICSVLFGFMIGKAPSANGSPDGGTVTLSYTQSGTKYKKTYHHAKVAFLMTPSRKSRDFSQWWLTQWWWLGSHYPVRKADPTC